MPEQKSQREIEYNNVATLINTFIKALDAQPTASNGDIPNLELTKHEYLIIKKLLASINGLYFEAASISTNKHFDALKTAIEDAKKRVNDPSQLKDSLSFLIFFMMSVVYERRIKGMNRSSAEKRFLEFATVTAPKKKPFASQLEGAVGACVFSVIDEEIKQLILMREDAAHNFTKFEKQLNDKVRTVTDEIDAKLAGIEKQNSRVEILADRVEKLRSKMNFATLGDAFEHFIGQKEAMKKVTFEGMLTLGCFVGIIPIILICLYLFNGGLPIKVPLGEEVVGTADKILFMLPITALELIFLYYFRISLKQYSELDAQLLQLNLRLSICQFIEDYVKFKKDGDKGTELAKFEELVFSNLMSSAEQMPSTFDGLEPLAKLIKQLK